MTERNNRVKYLASTLNHMIEGLAELNTKNSSGILKEKVEQEYSVADNIGIKLISELMLAQWRVMLLEPALRKTINDWLLETSLNPLEIGAGVLNSVVKSISREEFEECLNDIILPNKSINMHSVLKKAFGVNLTSVRMNAADAWIGMTENKVHGASWKEFVNWPMPTRVIIGENESNDLACYAMRKGCDLETMSQILAESPIRKLEDFVHWSVLSKRTDVLNLLKNNNNESLYLLRSNTNSEFLFNGANLNTRGRFVYFENKYPLTKTRKPDTGELYAIPTPDVLSWMVGIADRTTLAGDVEHLRVLAGSGKDDFFGQPNRWALLVKEIERQLLINSTGCTNDGVDVNKKRKSL